MERGDVSGRGTEIASLPIMPSQRIYQRNQPGSPMFAPEEVTPEEAFEMEVYYAMDEFRIDYAIARYAVAEKAVVTAVIAFGAQCRGLKHTR